MLSKDDFYQRAAERCQSFVSCWVSNYQLTEKKIKLKTYAYSLGVSNTQPRQPKALEKSFSNAPNDLPVSTNVFHLSVKEIRQCGMLKPSLKSH